MVAPDTLASAASCLICQPRRCISNRSVPESRRTPIRVVSPEFCGDTAWIVARAQRLVNRLRKDFCGRLEFLPNSGKGDATERRG